jgi:hypothetical protein
MSPWTRRTILGSGDLRGRVDDREWRTDRGGVRGGLGTCGRSTRRFVSPAAGRVGFVILLSTLTASLLLLIPGQGRVAVGVEMLAIGAPLVYRAVHTWPIVRATLRREAEISYAVTTDWRWTRT